jgi:hypothetical protein
MESGRSLSGVTVISYFTHRWVVAATCIFLSMLAIDAPAQVIRPYQMTLSSTEDNGQTLAGVDIPLYSTGNFANQPQPAGRSIVWLKPDPNLDQHTIDWSRIVAVYVNEPYRTILSCSNSAYDNMADNLAAMAAAVHARAPWVRFWVDFSPEEFELMWGRSRCPYNQPYIDVIATYDYYINFDPTLTLKYRWLKQHRATPYQQFALVPGTFTHLPKQDGAAGASRLSGYFEYATIENQTCDLPLGPTGATGIYDGCPIWIIHGWTAGTKSPADATFIVPLDHPQSALIHDRWQAAFVIPRRDPSRVRKALPLIPTWLEN